MFPTRIPSKSIDRFDNEVLDHQLDGGAFRNDANASLTVDKMAPT